MKKVLIVLFVVFLLVCFSSCSISENNSNQTNTPENQVNQADTPVNQVNQADTPAEKTTCVTHNYTSSVIKEATYDTEGEISYVCVNCGYSYTQVIEQLTKHTVPENVLNKVLSDMRYDISQQFSIPMGQLINYSIDGYKLQYYSVEEAPSLGYLFEGDLPETADEDMVYIAVVSGNTKVNPEIPYMTEYEDQALVAYMEFDENNNLIDYGYDACSNLHNCALIMFSSSF